MITVGKFSMVRSLGVTFIVIGITSKSNAFPIYQFVSVAVRNHTNMLDVKFVIQHQVLQTGFRDLLIHGKI